MKVTINVEWIEDEGGLESERALEIAGYILKRGYPVDVVIENY